MQWGKKKFTCKASKFELSSQHTLREVKTKMEKVGEKLNQNGVDWSVVVCLFACDSVFALESEKEVQRVIDQFYSVCDRWKLKVNAVERKVMVFEKS